MSKEDGLLEWTDMPDGTRAAIVRIGDRTGMMVIKGFEETRLVELVLVLGSVIGASPTVTLEEVAQTWMERVGGEPG